jgi:RNA polymerase sigma factor (TIGR02999 family)
MIPRAASPPAPGEITRLLLSLSHGDRTALDQLVPLLYRELRRIAAAYLKRERRGHTLQPTALVNELYLRLAAQKRLESHSRAQFLAIAANLIRQILVNHAERRRALKRDAGERIDLDNAVMLTVAPSLDVVAIDKALSKLAQLDARQSRIVELRFFGGLTEDEVAGVLGVSAVTVARDWRVARAMLHHELRSGRMD